MPKKIKSKLRVKKNKTKTPNTLNTAWADKIYGKEKVNTALTKTGRHTNIVRKDGSSGRGDKKSKHHKFGDGKRLGTDSFS
jgi:hypothetical protein|tara:strand:- start:28258 stop:28500 length:243 start_codon:yes stop_codon:yes gene_type:complete